MTIKTSRKMCGKEAGHVLLHAPDQRQPFTCRGVIEVEAESVAFMVTAAHGLDASQYTFNYVAGWAHQAVTPDAPSVEEIVKATGQRVIGATDRILQATQPAPTLVYEALADLGVEVRRPVDAVTPTQKTTVDADARVPRPVTTPFTTDIPGARAASVPVSVWERVTTPALDGAARERQALPTRPVGPVPALRR